MAEQVADDLRVVAGGLAQAGGAVPQIVEPDGREAAPVRERLEPDRDPLRRQGRAVLFGEDQALVGPAWAPCEMFGGLVL
ncbi:MAG TPA: hypothetical protein VMV07_23690, partial [Streptosporangiaceae bacterium]|nr:hypothetical protein [Streptosporangiaceae bacterium]